MSDQPTRVDDDAALVRELLEVARTRDRRFGLPRWAAIAVARLSLVVAVLAAWEYASGRLIRKFWVSRPSDIVDRLAFWVSRGDLWVHLQVTFVEMVVGFAAGTLLGVVAGLALGVSPRLERITNPVNVAFNTLPKIALAPVLILLFGIGLLSKVILVASVVFYFVLFNTIAGVRQVDPELVACIRVLGAGKLQVFAKVLVPGAMTYVFAGIKIAVRYALAYAVVGEIMASNRGLGFLAESAAGNMDTAGVFAAITLLMVYGLVLHVTVSRFEAFTLRWKA